MKRFLFPLLLCTSFAAAQSWHVITDKNMTAPMLRATNGRTSLTIYCGEATPMVEFRAGSQLVPSDTAVRIDGQFLPVDWSLYRDASAMFARKSDVQGLAYLMRHSREIYIAYDTPQSSTSARFSLTGLDAIMKSTHCQEQP